MDSKYLVLANAYPSDGDIYKYVFVHQRVKYYAKTGLDVTVFRVDVSGGSEASYSYDGVNVITGNVEALALFLAKTKFAAYLIHFPVPYILQTLAEHVPDAKVIAWLHGYETEAWHRRWFDYLAVESLGKLDGIERNFRSNKFPFLQSLYSGTLLDVRFVVVSNWFLKHRVEIDAGRTLTNPNVISNFVDTEYFVASKKSNESRLRFLSIRPFTSRKYANDLTVQAILSLRDHPLWDELHFTICGDGPLFDETVEPMRSYANVTIMKGFLSQQAIRELHQSHGVFIAPTRFDSQGVSTCEAMSSGLVPVSTDITAVPEFIEHGVSGLLCSPESSSDLSKAFISLIDSPSSFAEMSVAAAEKVRQTSAAEVTVIKEIEMITNESVGRGQDYGPVDWEAAYADILVEMTSLAGHIGHWNR